MSQLEINLLLILPGEREIAFYVEILKPKLTLISLGWKNLNFELLISIDNVEICVVGA